MTTKEAVLEAALELSRVERIDLMEKITDSIERANLQELPGWDADVQSRWVAEARRRIAEFRSGTTTETVTHDELMLELDQRLSQ